MGRRIDPLHRSEFILYGIAIQSPETEIWPNAFSVSRSVSKTENEREVYDNQSR